MKTLRKDSFFYEIRKNKVLYLMFLPVALYFFIFAYIPMPGIVVAFKAFTYSGGIFGSKWNGLENFRYFFESGKLLQVTINTVFYNLIFLGFSTVLSVLAGILISEMVGRFFKKLAQTFMFLPYFISWVTVSAFMYNLFSYDFGAVNTLLRSAGMQPLDIYSEYLTH